MADFRQAFRTVFPRFVLIFTLTSDSMAAVQAQCRSNPCINGGTCRSLIWPLYKCYCPCPYFGTHCEFSANPSHTNFADRCSYENRTCLNGGECVVSDSLCSIRCQCLPEFYGNTCQNKCDPFIVDGCANTNISCQRADYCREGVCGRPYCRTTEEYLPPINSDSTTTRSVLIIVFTIVACIAFSFIVGIWLYKHGRRCRRRPQTRQPTVPMHLPTTNIQPKPPKSTKPEKYEHTLQPWHTNSEVNSRFPKPVLPNDFTAL